MQAFLYINLSSSATPYEQPVLARVKNAIPGIAMLDLDAQSDTMLQQYAVRMLQESEKAIVCICSGNETAGYGSIMPVVEELLNPHPGRLLLLHGSNQRILRMLQARPRLSFLVVEDEEVLYREAVRFLQIT